MHRILSASALCALVSLPVAAQSPTDLVALKGLAPVSALPNTLAGQAALGANYTVTGGIQTGAITQPTLLPFPEQQQQALRDAFISSGNLANLADGLGTSLGSAYLARAHCIDPVRCTNVSQAVAEILAEPLGRDVVTGLGVYLPKADTWADRIDGQFLSHPHRLVYLALPAVRLAQADRHRLVRAVAPVKRAEIDRDQFAGGDGLVRGLAVRQRPPNP